MPGTREMLGDISLIRNTTTVKPVALTPPKGTTLVNSQGGTPLVDTMKNATVKRFITPAIIHPQGILLSGDYTPPTGGGGGGGGGQGDDDQKDKAGLSPLAKILIGAAILAAGYYLFIKK